MNTKGVRQKTECKSLQKYCTEHSNLKKKVDYTKRIISGQIYVKVFQYSL